VEALKKLKLALIAITCHFTHEGLMLDGTSPEIAANVLMDAGATIVGANCGDDPESFVSIAHQMRTQQREGKYWLFQPGAGLPVRDANNHLHYPTSPESFATTMQEIVTARTILGGCCGTTSAHIQALYSRLHQP
jgi:methionine synthase I (cobalamin-dependent)